jgi:hypothetical protein
MQVLCKNAVCGGAHWVHVIVWRPRICHVGSPHLPKTQLGGLQLEMMLLARVSHMHSLLERVLELACGAAVRACCSQHARADAGWCGTASGRCCRTSSWRSAATATCRRAPGQFSAPPAAPRGGGAGARPPGRAAQCHASRAIVCVSPAAPSGGARRSAARPRNTPRNNLRRTLPRPAGWHAPAGPCWVPHHPAPAVQQRRRARAMPGRARPKLRALSLPCCRWPCTRWTACGSWP